MLKEQAVDLHPPAPPPPPRPPGPQVGQNDQNDRQTLVVLDSRHFQAGVGVGRVGVGGVVVIVG